MNNDRRISSVGNRALRSVIAWAFISVFASGCMQSGTLIRAKKKSVAQVTPDDPTSGVPGGVPGQIPAGGTTGGGTVSSGSLVIADRAQVASNLAKIFGRSAPQNRGTFDASSGFATANFVKRNLIEFGAPCDLYLNTPYQTDLERNIMSRSDRSASSIDYKCRNDGETDVNPSAPLTVTRGALVIRTCDQILGAEGTQWTNYADESHGYTHDTGYAIRNAATFARGIDANASEPKDFNELGMPKDADFDGAYALFFPGRTIDATGRAALASVVSTSKTQMSGASVDDQARDAWKFLFLTLCYTGQWQVL